MRVTVEKGFCYTHAGDKYKYFWTAEHDAAEGEAAHFYRTPDFSHNKITIQTVAGDLLTEVCGVSVPDGGRSPLFHTCGKKIKDEHLCGVHLAAKNREATKAAERREISDLSDANKERARAALAEAGISGRPYYNSMTGKYTGEVIVKSEDLLSAFQLDHMGMKL